MMTIDEVQKFANDTYISTDDLTSHLEEVEADRQGLVAAADEAESDAERHDYEKELDLWDDENGEAYADLKKACDGLPEGETMIHEGKIDEYLYDFVQDCYSLPKDLPSFVSLTIDYDALKQDYTEVEYEGSNYYVRYV
jgi:hypothetical protein